MNPPHQVSAQRHIHLSLPPFLSYVAFLPIYLSTPLPPPGPTNAKGLISVGAQSNPCFLMNMPFFCRTEDDAAKMYVGTAEAGETEDTIQFLLCCLCQCQRRLGHASYGREECYFS